MPEQNDIQQALLDFHATVMDKPNLSDADLFKKFPEFGNDSKKLQAAKDYAATLESGKYKSASDFNNKFPEFFGQEKPKGKGVKAIKEQGPFSTAEEIQKMPSNPIADSIREDRETNHEFLKSVWNTGVNSFQRLAGSLAELSSKGTFSAGVGAPGLGGDYKQPSLTGMQRVEMARGIKQDLEKDVFGKVKFDVPKSQQEGMKFDLSDGLGISDLQGIGVGLAGLGVDLGINAITGGTGTTFALQAMNDAFDEYDQSVKQQGVETDPKARDFYGFTTGIIVGALQKVGFDKIFKGAPKVLQGIKSKVFAEVMLDIEKSKANVTAKTIEDLVNQKTKDVMKSSVVKRYGIPMLSGGATGAIMGGGTEGAKDINKLVSNAIQGSQAFNEKDINENWLKNIVNGSAQGFVYGAALTPFHVFMQKTDNEILNQVVAARTPEQMDAVLSHIDNAMNQYKFTDDEKSLVKKSIDDYVSIKKTIPSTMNETHQLKIIPLIKNRNEINSDIQAKQQEVSNIDESLKQQELDNIQVLQDRKDGINQQIQDIANNKEQPIDDIQDIYKGAEPYIIGDQARQDVSNVVVKINNAENINENELSKAADHLYELLDKHGDNQSFSNLIEPLINKIEGYEFATKTETSTVTQRVPAKTLRKNSGPKVTNELENFSGDKATITDANGKEISGLLKSENGIYYLHDEAGNKIATIGEKAMTDRGITLPTVDFASSPIEFNEDGTVKSITLDLSQLNKTKGGMTDNKNVKIDFTDPQKGLDFAIRLRADQVGEIPEAQFDTEYQTISKEVPKYTAEELAKMEANKKQAPKVELTEEQKQSNIDKATAQQRAEAINQTEQEYGSTTNKGVPTGEATGVSGEVPPKPTSEPEFLSKATEDELAKYRELDKARRADESKFRTEYESDEVVKLTGESEEQYLRRKACG